MSLPDPIAAAESPQALADLNRWLVKQTAPERIEWAVEHLAGHHALSSSFGAQAAVALHMTTQAKPDIPVILIDTGYLFPETYRFVDEISTRLSLNLKVYRPPAPQPDQQPRRYRRSGTARRPLETAPHRRLDRPRCVEISPGQRPALSPAVGSGLRLDRRHPHHQSPRSRHERRRHPLFRPQARVRPARRLGGIGEKRVKQRRVAVSVANPTITL
mgnify:CR=1 FL=1